MNKYPFFRVILAFVFAPAVGGVIAIMVVAFLVDVDPYAPYSNHSPKDFLLDGFKFTLFLMISATVLQCVPAFVLGFLCACMKLKRGIVNCICLSIGGGLAAFSWMHILVPCPCIFQT